MSDLDKDLENLSDLELDNADDITNEFDNLADFVDLENLEGFSDLGGLSGLEDLGDLSDLGDFSGMDDLFKEEENPVAEDAANMFQTVEPQEKKSAEFSDIGVPDLSDLDMSDMLDLDMPDISEAVEPEVPKSEKRDVDSVDSSLDDMLDGLLDNLDTTGSFDSVEENIPKEEPVQQEDSGKEEGLDDLLSMLGGTSDEPSMDVEDEFGLEDMLGETAEEELIPAASSEEPEKPGMMKRLFGNIVTDEIAEQELAARAAEEEAAEIREQEAQKAKEEADAAKAAKAEEKAAKKAKRDEAKALKRAAKAEAKAAKKEAREAEEQAELEIVGKLNKVGVSIIVVLTILFLTAEISGTKIFSYRSTMKQAENYFDMQRYTQAYQEILGTDIKKSDRETYDKIVTVMKVQRSLNAYTNYENMKYYPDALNALLRGMQKYDENIEMGRNLEIEKDMDSCREQIVSILYDEFGLSESEAYDILAMDKEEYTQKVVEIGMDMK